MNCHIFWNSALNDNIEVDAVRKINDGELFEVLQSPIIAKLFSGWGDNPDEEPVKVWRKRIEEYAASECNTSEMELEFVALGVASLLLFVQQNWTGPEIPSRHMDLFHHSNEGSFLKSKRAIHEALVMDGENMAPSVENPELLLISRLILMECHKKFKLKVTIFWLLRCLFINQQIVEESSSYLFGMIRKTIKEIESMLRNHAHAHLAELNLEFARMHLYYGHVQKSKLNIEQALKSCGMQTSLIGALGKRTKFQQEDLPQLTLKVEIDGETNPSGTTTETMSLPVDLKLEDDVRLNQIKFKEESDGKHPHLSELQQAVVLGLFCQTQKSQAKDKLTEEELQPLISCLLSEPKVWSIKLTTLLFRSKMESTHKRGVERAMMQIQALVDNIKSDKPAIKDRLRFFFVSYQPPRWEMEAALAGIMTRLGAVKSALDIYLRLQDWENVILCYRALELESKAREIIEQELEKSPTPKLWCHLGDVTKDVTHYETAWKVSKEKSARAQRHWAMHYFNRCEYGKSIEHFQLSLNRNSLQSNLWYRLGYAALHEGDWDTSANAYRRYCALNPECFEAWNNLARCYCETNQKRRAWKALQEALKIDYTNWKVWDNYMLVSSDLQEFEEVIRSYQELLNLKEKHVDVGILRSLVYGLKEMESSVSDEAQESQKRLKNLRKKLLSLFGRLTSRVLNNAELWYLYASVVPSDDDEENLTKRQWLMTKAYCSATNNPNWVNTIESCSDVFEILQKLAEVSLLLKDRSVLVSCALSASGFSSRVKSLYPDSDLSAQAKTLLDRVREEIEDAD